MCTHIYIFFKCVAYCQLASSSRKRTIGNLPGFYYCEFTSIPTSPVTKVTFHSYTCLSVGSNVGTR